ncbi:COG complex component [Babesia duncani]|uniref:COG complex component n=1 Tax=Babesia duncani TaxID=323732 RepID=A0AAD9PMV4_9APIC|nr:COG complex component [Babesia duncani]
MKTATCNVAAQNDENVTMSTRALYKESLDKINALHQQLECPSRFIAQRLTTCSLDEIKRELASLQDASQMHASALIRTSFAEAAEHNGYLKEVVNGVYPLKHQTHRFIENLDELRKGGSIKHMLVGLLDKYALVAYAKLTLEAYIQAKEQLHIVCECLIENFPMYHNCMQSPDDMYAEALHVIDAIGKNFSISHKDGDVQNLCANIEWFFFEFLPAELMHAQMLIRKAREYKVKLSKVLEVIVNKNDQPHTSWIREIKPGMVVENLIEHLHLLNEDELKGFKQQFSFEETQKQLDNLKINLKTLVQICTKWLLTELFQIYENNTPNMHAEYETLMQGLVSIITCSQQFHKPGFGTHLMDSFSIIFFQPIFKAWLQRGTSFVFNLSAQDEVIHFTSFVDSIEKHLLSCNGAIMQFLDSVSEALGHYDFKIACIHNVVAVAIFQHIQQNFSSISFAIYPELYLLNYHAYERLLTILETLNGTNFDHYLIWRGSHIPRTFSNNFLTSAISEGSINSTVSGIMNELDKFKEIDGRMHKCGDVGFYTANSAAVYNGIIMLLDRNRFFYHLLPNYQCAITTVIKRYSTCMQDLINQVQNVGNEAHNTLGSGFSFSYTAYFLQDIYTFTKLLSVGSLADVKIGPTNSIGSNELVLLYPDTFGLMTRSMLQLAEFPLVGCMQKCDEAQLSSLFQEAITKLVPNDEKTSQLREMEDKASTNVLKLVEFTVKSMWGICEVFRVLHENFEKVTINLKRYIVDTLTNNVRCSFQFVQSLPYKFRGSIDALQVPEKPSPYVRLLVVPLLSFSEFSDAILDGDILHEIVTATVCNVCEEYNRQITSMLENVEAVNATLRQGDAANILHANTNLIRQQLRLDVEDFYRVCTERLNVTNMGSLDLLITNHKL